MGYEDSSYNVYNVIDTLASGTWTPTTPPLTGLTPPLGPDRWFVLSSIACPATGSCVAAGDYQDATYRQQGLIETLSGGTWTAKTAPLTGLTAPTPSANPGVYLASVACPTVGSRVAAGIYKDSSGNTQGLIEALTNGSWRATTAPLNGLTPPPGTNPTVYFGSIACPAAGSCVAISSYEDSSSQTRGLIETLSGGTWTAKSAPLGGLSPAAGADPHVGLFSISCPTAGSCVVAGIYQDSSSHTQGLIETLSGGTWTATTAPLSGLTPPAGTNPGAGLVSVSCPGTGSCVAVSTYTDATGHEHGLVDTLSGGTWTATTAPLGGLSPAAGADPAVYIGAVSCPATGSCVAVGEYQDASGITRGLIETLSGGTWTATTAPLGGLTPARSTNSASALLFLSCPVAASCVAVGEYPDASGITRGLIETLTNGTWTATTAPLGAGLLTPLVPARILDTRTGIGAAREPVGAGQTLRLQVDGRGGVPAEGVGAVVLNVTVTQPTEAGYITVYPDGATRPLASNLNFSAEVTVPNLVIAPVGADGEVDLFNGSSGTVELVADVSGWFAKGVPAAGGLAPLTPARLLDTRNGTGAAPDAVGAGQTVSLQVDGRGGVPTAGVGAVVLNVTVTQPTEPGYITAYPEGAPRPLASNLNFLAGQTVPNLVIVPVGPNGKIDIYNGSTGTIEVVADVSGWFENGAPEAGGLTPLTPARILDTRYGTGTVTGPVAPGGMVSLQVDGRGGVPAAGVGAVVLNVTVTAPGVPGYITAFPDGATLPVASNLNFYGGQTVANLVIAPVGADGKVDLFNGSISTVELIGDGSGWFS